MDQIFNLYNQFLNNFPVSLHPFISFLLGLAIVYAIIKIVQRDFIYIILLIVLLPASLPILKNVLDSLINIIKYLLAK